MFFAPSDLLPVDEKARLLTLSELDILHSLREPIFDEFVALATRLFKMPISLIGLVGGEEVGYKAAVGLPGLTRQAREEAICALVVQQNRAVVFTDLTQAAQYQQLTAAAYLNAQHRELRFYAGTPLRMPNQRVLGTLCVIDQQPREFGPPELYILEALAHLIGRLIAVRYACLVGSWLGENPWQAVQVYVTGSLRRLGQLARKLWYPGQRVAPLAIFRLAVRQLNELGSVLAEPLPGFI